MSEETEAIVDDGASRHHHHHHHHHRTGTSSSSGVYRAPGTGSYSISSFGKRGETTRNIPEGILPAAVLSVLFTALLLAPVIVSLFFRNKTLSDENFQLREKLGEMMMQAEEQGAQAGSAAPRTRYVEESAESALRTRYVTDAGDDAPVSEAVATPAEVPAPPVVNEEALASAVGMTAEELAALRREMYLYPNGLRLAEDAVGKPAYTRDVLAQNLQNGLKLLAIGQKRDAEAIFAMIVSAKPQWPYGHFYLAVASGSREEMAKTARLLSTARALGVSTPEGELYSALAALFQKANYSASSSLARVALDPSRDTLQLGPVYVPSYAPADVLSKLRALRGIGEVKTIDW